MQAIKRLIEEIARAIKKGFCSHVYYVITPIDHPLGGFRKCKNCGRKQLYGYSAWDDEYGWYDI